MLKHLELSTPTSCLNKAGDDEPIFVLRAKDPIAAYVVALWAELAPRHHSKEKAEQALAEALIMDTWYVKNERVQRLAEMTADNLQQ